MTTLDDAIALAASFLRERLRGGLYGLSCFGREGTSNFSHEKGHIFVAWFVTEAMTGLFDEIDRTIVLVRILSEEIDGRWGYAPPGLHHRPEFLAYHVDADDSAYAIRTLQRLGVNREPKALLSFYRENERLFVTFDAPGPASLTLQASPSNNLFAHPEVNLNVFLALKPTHFGHLVDYQMLRATQDANGYWASYFYPSDLFATHLALGVLEGTTGFDDVARRALAYIADAQHPNGSWGDGGDAHETALAIAALAGRPEYTAVARRGAEHLLRTMLADGSWNSEASIWEFHLPDGEILRAHDGHRTYVTARCLTALRMMAGQLPT